MSITIYVLTDGRLTRYCQLCQNNFDLIYYAVFRNGCLKSLIYLYLMYFQHHFGAYTDWVRDDFDHTDDGYKKLEAFVNDYYSRGKLDKNKALHYYSESMEWEAAFFDSIPA